MGAKHKLTKPSAIGKAVALLGTGETHQTVADALGVSRPSISNLAAKHRDTINQLALDLITENHQVIADIARLTLSRAHKLLKTGSRKDIEQFNGILTLADRKEHRLLQIMGITPSHTPSVIIHNLFAAEGSVTPEQHTRFREFIEWQVDQDVQEGEIVEEDGDNVSTGDDKG